MTHTFLMQWRIKEAARAACLAEFLLFSPRSCFSRAAAVLHLLPHFILNVNTPVFLHRAAVNTCGVRWTRLSLALIPAHV